jgi:hypothetical protein
MVTSSPSQDSHPGNTTCLESNGSQDRYVQVTAFLSLIEAGKIICDVTEECDTASIVCGLDGRPHVYPTAAWTAACISGYYSARHFMPQGKGVYCRIRSIFGKVENEDGIRFSLAAKLSLFSFLGVSVDGIMKEEGMSGWRIGRIRSLAKTNDGI